MSHGTEYRPVFSGVTFSRGRRRESDNRPATGRSSYRRRLRNRPSGSIRRRSSGVGMLRSSRRRTVGGTGGGAGSKVLGSRVRTAARSGSPGAHLGAAGGADPAALVHAFAHPAAPDARHDAHVARRSVIFEMSLPTSRPLGRGGGAGGRRRSAPADPCRAGGWVRPAGRLGRPASRRTVIKVAWTWAIVGRWIGSAASMASIRSASSGAMPSRGMRRVSPLRDGDRGLVVGRGVEGRRRSGQELGVDQAEGEDVGRDAQLGRGHAGLLDVAEQFGGVVVDRADDLLRRRRAAGDVGAVEVDQLAGVAQLGALDQDVARLQVAVHDPQVVQDLQAVRHRLHQHQLQRRPSAAMPPGSSPRRRPSR